MLWEPWLYWLFGLNRISAENEALDDYRISKVQSTESRSQLWSWFWSKRRHALVHLWPVGSNYIRIIDRYNFIPNIIFIFNTLHVPLNIIWILSSLHVLYIIYYTSIVLYCIIFVLYCIMRPYRRPIRPLSYRHSSGESEIRTQPWLSEGSLTCDPYHHRGPIF